MCVLESLPGHFFSSHLFMVELNTSKNSFKSVGTNYQVLGQKEIFDFVP